MRAHPLGRDALETRFFGEVDTTGAIARDLLVESGPEALTSKQRCDFARLLLSLDARRPAAVAKIRDGAAQLAASLDSDPDILQAFFEEGITERPSDYYDQHGPMRIEDRAITLIQKLVDNPQVGGRLVNAHGR